MSDRTFSALILAGGRGSRMPGDAPKPLVTVAGRSLVEHNVLRAFRAGAAEVFVAVCHRADEIAAHLEAVLGGEGRLAFVREPQPLGTIGALGLLRAHGCTAPTVLSANGDLLSAIDLSALVTAHFDSGADATVATHGERHRLTLGEVISDAEHRITAYREKPVKEYRISSGTNVFGPRIVELVDGRSSLGVPDLIERALARGLDLRVFPHDHAWIDVNDADDLAAASALHDERRAEFHQSLRPNDPPR